MSCKKEMDTLNEKNQGTEQYAQHTVFCVRKEGRESVCVCVCTDIRMYARPQKSRLVTYRGGERSIM